jgi:integrase
VGKKKQKGNGTVYPRKNKAGKGIGYRGSYFTPDGKRRYVAARRKSEAEKLLRKAMTDTDRGLTFDAGTLRLGQYLDKWLPGIRDTVRQRTWERYEQLVRVHITPARGQETKGPGSRPRKRALYREAGLRLSQDHSVHPCDPTHKALKDAVSDGLIPKNVADGIKPSKPKKKEITRLTQSRLRPSPVQYEGIATKLSMC